MHEAIDSEQRKPALAAMRSALDANTPFEINRETLQATLVCDGRYSLEYIYEVDGWKVMNIRPQQSTPNRAHGK